jgi:hypothetical protein
MQGVYNQELRTLRQELNGLLVVRKKRAINDAMDQEAKLLGGGAAPL